jgi:membrane protein implicated in regulation of membrane protease activity
VSAWVWWLVAAVVLGIVEVTTLDLVFAMLSVGAVAGAVVAATSAGLILQTVIAVLVALAMLFVVRPVALRHLRSAPETRTGVAALVGAKGVVLERVDRHDGRIKLAGEIWSARSYDPDHVIEVGSTVDVLKIEGATALVYDSER